MKWSIYLQARRDTFALVGIDAVEVVAEVDAAVGLPKTVLVGLPEAAVRESIHRIERALVNLGYRRHSGQTVINLAPAELKKDAGAYDLPVALALSTSLTFAGRSSPSKLPSILSVRPPDRSATHLSGQPAGVTPEEAGSRRGRASPPPGR